eukprot:GFUD01037270.1.p2 GENE.GFUD01037270.1~~GFUD01037270.1.p2  ORF type:complete len:112 (-),score=7.43 GFUD01037270.1:31-366(-)
MMLKIINHFILPCQNTLVDIPRSAIFVFDIRIISNILQGDIATGTHHTSTTGTRHTSPGTFNEIGKENSTQASNTVSQKLWVSSNRGPINSVNSCKMFSKIISKHPFDVQI